MGHPFDTIKVRLQTSKTTQFKGPVDCLMQTIRNEGVKGLYKGATPPLVGWMFMDSMFVFHLRIHLWGKLYSHRLLVESKMNPD